MKQYIPEKMVAQSRYRRYFPTLPADVQADVYARMRELIEEERPFCDEGNYAHMAQILTSIALYEVLQAHGASEEEAYRAVPEEMWAFLDPSGMPLETLLEQHELDDITVKQICSQANIGKTTFLEASERCVGMWNTRPGQLFHAARAIWGWIKGNRPFDPPLRRPDGISVHSSVGPLRLSKSGFSLIKICTLISNHGAMGPRRGHRPGCAEHPSWRSVP